MRFIHYITRLHYLNSLSTYNGTSNQILFICEELSNA